MGILDNVKHRLGFSDGGADWEDDYEEYERDDPSDEYDEGDRRVSPRRGSQRDSSGRTTQAPSYVRSGNVIPRSNTESSFRSDYRNDDHAPLVSLSDVRSQRSSTVSEPQRQRIDRIPVPQPVRRGTSPVTDTSRESSTPSYDASYKDALANSNVHSLPNLQRERARFEDVESRISAPKSGTSQPASSASSSSRDPFSGYTGTPTGSLSPCRRLEVFRPVAYGEVENVARSLKAGDVVVLSLSLTRPELAKRILDFTFGVASALEGTVDRLADKVFVITRSGAITEDERAQLRSAGII